VEFSLYNLLGLDKSGSDDSNLQTEASSQTNAPLPRQWTAALLSKSGVFRLLTVTLRRIRTRDVITVAGLAIGQQVVPPSVRMLTG